ncbi:hypothetical protein [Hydrocarboniphaga effusa]
MPVSKRHFLLAAAAHAALILLMIFGVQCQTKIEPPPVMVAMVVPKPSAKQDTPTDTPRVTPEQKTDDMAEQRKAEEGKRQEELKKREQ